MTPIETIRARLAIVDEPGYLERCLLARTPGLEPTWDEVRALLREVDNLRESLEVVGPDESDLRAIEENVNSLTDETRRAGRGYVGMPEDVLALVAEVRRLRREEVRHAALLRALRGLANSRLLEETP